MIVARNVSGVGPHMSGKFYLCVIVALLCDGKVFL
jgi:hypothetical protein